MRVALMFLLALVMATPACRPRSSGNSAAQSLEAVPLTAMEQGTLRFGIDFYKTASYEFGDGNFFFSPFSLSVALAMVHAGARGRTADEIAKIIHLASANPYAAYRDELAQLKEASGEQQTIRVYDNLWLEQTFAVQKDFQKILQDNFAADVTAVDFINKPDAQRELINQEVAKQTDGMIKDLLAASDVDSLVRLILTNAIFFQAAWQYPFDPKHTKPADFMVTADQKVKVPMMRQKTFVRYFENEWVRGIELPYGENGDFVMTILLPVGVDSMSLVEEKLDVATLQAWWHAATLQFVDIQFPSFKAGGDVSALKVLKAMGLEALFDGEKANLSKINSDASPSLYVSQVAHQARVEVDEKGTKAAAATGVVVAVRGAARPVPHQEFIVNRPFLFGITKKGAETDAGDRSFGNLLFFGRINDPTSL